MEGLSFYEKVLNHLVNYYGFLFGDALYIKMRYRVIFGKSLNLKKPKSFYEKIQWLKLHDRREKYHMMADKYGVRNYVEDKVGSKYLIPLIGHWNAIEEVDEALLPEKFVIKCTHDSQSVRICNDKDDFDFDEIKRDFSKALTIDYSKYGREWAYSGIVPSIIAEELLTDQSGVELKDYKFFCFNGEPKVIQVDYNRFTGHKRRMFSPDWKQLDVKITYPDDPNVVLEKPDKLDEMLEICRKLSADMYFLRVDLYFNGEIYVGELTFYPGGGFEPIEPYEVDLEWGRLLHLPCDD